MANIDNIELRSEKTQQILSVIPSFFCKIRYTNDIRNNIFIACSYIFYSLSR